MQQWEATIVWSKYRVFGKYTRTGFFYINLCRLQWGLGMYVCSENNVEDYIHFYAYTVFQIQSLKRITFKHGNFFFIFNLFNYCVIILRIPSCLCMEKNRRWGKMSMWEMLHNQITLKSTFFTWLIRLMKILLSCTCV